jgi:ferredoxin
VSSVLRLAVDRERCLGHARCVALAPALFSFDETAERAEVLAAVVPAEEREAAERAYRSCPENAITLGEA